MLTTLEITKALSAVFNDDVTKVFLKRGGRACFVHFLLNDLFDETWFYSAVVYDNGKVDELIPIKCMEDVRSRMDGDEEEFDVGWEFSGGFGTMVVSSC